MDTLVDRALDLVKAAIVLVFGGYVIFIIVKAML